MKRQLSFMLGIVMAVFLCACNTNGGASEELTAEQAQYVSLACASSSAAMKVVTVAINADKLSKEQRDIVGEAADRIAPICGSPTPPTLTSLQEEAFSQAVAVIAVQAAKHRSPD